MSEFNLSATKYDVSIWTRLFIFPFLKTRKWITWDAQLGQRLVVYYKEYRGFPYVTEYINKAV